MYFVTVEHRYAAEGATYLIEEQTLVYGELQTTAPPVSPQAAPDNADVAQRYTLDSTALFRYSALTFNGHRIHYDADYCREVEGYPGLVVHGPLIATLMLLGLTQMRACEPFQPVGSRGGRCWCC